jgi:hypothetical protein
MNVAGWANRGLVKESRWCDFGMSGYRRRQEIRKRRYQENEENGRESRTSPEARKPGRVDTL